MLLPPAPPHPGILASGMKTHGGPMAGQERWLWRQAIWVKILARSLSGCVTMGMSLNLSELLCPYPINGENKADWPGFWGVVSRLHRGQGPPLQVKGG